MLDPHLGNTCCVAGPGPAAAGTDLNKTDFSVDPPSPPVTWSHVSGRGTVSGRRQSRRAFGLGPGPVTDLLCDLGQDTGHPEPPCLQCKMERQRCFWKVGRTVAREAHGLSNSQPPSNGVTPLSTLCHQEKLSARCPGSATPLANVRPLFPTDSKGLRSSGSGDIAVFSGCLF